MPEIITNNKLIEEILSEYQHVAAHDPAGYRGYRHHVYRMLNYTLYLTDAQLPNRVEKIAIAAAFHDIEVFKTFDYLDGSIALMQSYLKRIDRGDWGKELALMVEKHHSLSRYRGEYAALVEPFRQADLVDISLSLFRFGLPAQLVKELRTTLPLGAFYTSTIPRAMIKWVIRHPFQKPPILR